VLFYCQKLGKTMDKDALKEVVTAIITYGWIVVLAMLGGLVKFMDKLNNSKEPKPLKYIIFRLIAEMITSGFAGIITVLLCVYWGMPIVLIAAIAGIAGHLGGKAIDTFILIWKSIISGGKVP